MSTLFFNADGCPNAFVYIVLSHRLIVSLKYLFRVYLMHSPAWDFDPIL